MFTSREGSILKLPMGGRNSSFGDNRFSYFTYSREAIFEILKSNEIGPDDEILLPNYVCSTVIDSIMGITKKVKYYRIDYSLGFDKSEVISLIKDETKLIVFVDYFGVQTKIDKDIELALKENDVIIVKDAAHSFLSLVDADFVKDYDYDYLISSIYKNLPTQVGCIAIGRFNRKFEFINSFILVKRILVLFFKNVLCFFGLQRKINSRLSQISVSNSYPVSYYYGPNALWAYKAFLFRLNFTKINSEKREVAKRFNLYFASSVICAGLFTNENLENNILQAYPVIFNNKLDRDMALEILRESCIDAYTWPTFHETNCDDTLWSRILLLPLDLKVLDAFRFMSVLKHGSTSHGSLPR